MSQSIKGGDTRNKILSWPSMFFKKKKMLSGLPDWKFCFVAVVVVVVVVVVVATAAFCLFVCDCLLYISFYFSVYFLH